YRSSLAPHGFILFFFLSSRRRHTSFSRDWSSDVCSSDLPQLSLPRQAVAAEIFRRRQRKLGMRRQHAGGVLRRPVPPVPDLRARSEERRGGEEGRGRSASYV